MKKIVPDYENFLKENEKKILVDEKNRTQNEKNRTIYILFI